MAIKSKFELIAAIFSLAGRYEEMSRLLREPMTHSEWMRMYDERIHVHDEMCDLKNELIVRLLPIARGDVFCHYNEWRFGKIAI